MTAIPLRLYKLTRSTSDSFYSFRCLLVNGLNYVSFRPLVNYKTYKEYSVSKIRNIGVSAHIDSGKTTLTERILFYTGRIQHMHEVKGKDGVGATMDSMELERSRGITIQSAATSVEWKQHNIQLIDTPGHVDFTVEVERALRVLDSAILVVCGSSGVQCQTMTVYRQINRYNVPFCIFINKLDKPNANAFKAMDDIRNRLCKDVAFVTIPMDSKNGVSGVIDVLNMKAIYFNGNFGENVEVSDIPEECKAISEKYHSNLIEQIADKDEEIGNMILEETVPSIQQLKQALRRIVVQNKFHPVFVGSALKNKGVQPLLDNIVENFPDPTERTNYAIDNSDDENRKVVCNPERSTKNPLLAFVFKLEAGRFGQLSYLRIYQGVLRRSDYVYNVRTRKRIKVNKLYRMHSDKMEDIDCAYAGDICTIIGTESATGDTLASSRDSLYSMESIQVANPVICMSFNPAHKNQVDNFTKAVNRFQREDPTFRINFDAELNQTVAYGMGELHLEVYAARIEKEFGVKVELGKPQVAYLETLSKPYRFDYLHKKQSGGQGQYGRVIGFIEPLSSDKYLEVEFKSELKGTNIPSQHVPTIKKTFMKCLENGELSGHRVSGIRFRLQDGDHHIVDSTEIAFSLATKGAMRDAFKEGCWQIIEPIMQVEVLVANEYQQEVVKQLLKRFAIIRHQQTRDNFTVFDCQVPLNDMFGFSTTLRSATKGTGEFSMEYSCYASVRGDVKDKLTGDFRSQMEVTSAGTR
ncbi:hypothetical protein GJ496_007964 [Pomphorhynchus laevis]|nr:hypothetical protein GJ496_007964 [Pomphorhynchus laevis]